MSIKLYIKEGDLLAPYDVALAGDLLCHPPGSLYSSVVQGNPGEALGGEWLYFQALTGGPEPVYQYKRVALPRFRVEGPHLLMEVPDYAGDAQVAAIGFSLGEGNLMVQLPQGFVKIGFAVNNGEVEATMQ